MINLTAVAPQSIRHLPSNEDLLDEYKTHSYEQGLKASTIIGRLYEANKFLTKYKDLDKWFELKTHEKQKTINSRLAGFITFLILKKYFLPDYDYLFSRRLDFFKQEIHKNLSVNKLSEFEKLAITLKYSSITLMTRILLLVMAHTGKEIQDLMPHDFIEFREAVNLHEKLRQKNRSYVCNLINPVQVVLYHMEIFKELPVSMFTYRKETDAQKFSFVKSSSISNCILVYLEKIRGNHKQSTVAQYITSLIYFMHYMQEIDPDFEELSQLSRQKHIEPWLIFISKLDVSEGHRKNLILGVKSFFYNIIEWGWEEAPSKLLIFDSDLPKIPQPLPRYIPVEIEKPFIQAVSKLKNPFARCGLQIMRNTGIRSGELLDLEMNCVHEIKGKGYWLKVPLGKLNTERMVPLGEETVALIDELVKIRSPQRAIINPRTGKLSDFLFVNRGKRVSSGTLVNGIKEAVLMADLKDNDGNPLRITSHQLRHTYATTLINGGMSIQALMKLLGHVSSTMTLRYAHLFDSSVKNEYEKALQNIKPKYSSGMLANNLTDTEYINGLNHPQSLIKTSLANGYCLRSAVQGTCKYAYICETCGCFETDRSFEGVLQRQLENEKVTLERVCQEKIASEIARHKSIINTLEKLLVGVK